MLRASEQPDNSNYPRHPNFVVRANHVPGPRQGEWTYRHYAAIPDDGIRYEIVDGVLYMAPAPTWGHQSISALITTYLMIHVQFRGLGRVCAAPLDVELALKTVVQPDVLVILNENREVITPSRVIGSPDLAVEVLSPGTRRHDRQRKFHAYARAGIQEYWIVDPLRAQVEAWILEDDCYQPLGVFSGVDEIRSKAIPVFPVQARQFFE